MTSVRTALVSFMCLLAAAGCGSNTSDNSYKDSLTFALALAATASTWSARHHVLDRHHGHPRDDLLQIGKRGGHGSARWSYLHQRWYYGMEDYPSLQSYGHYLLSTFRITDTGTFTVKGYLVEQVGPDIGKETFVAGSTITTTP